MPDIREEIIKEIDEKNNMGPAKQEGLMDLILQNWLPILATVIIIGALVFFAGRLSAGGGEGNNNVVQLVTADSVSIAISSPQKLNPLTTQDKDIIQLNDIIYSSLFKLDGTYNISPDLVIDYETNREAGQVNLEILHDVKFSNGTPLNAEDIVFTWKSIVDIGEVSHYYESAYKIASIESRGPWDLVVTFKHPGDASLDNLIFPIVPSDSYNNSIQLIPGSGPYAYGSYSVGNSIKVLPNTYYYGTIPEKPLECVVVQPRSAISYLIATDEITAATSEIRLSNSWSKDPRVTEKTMLSGEYDFLGFSCRRPVMSNSAFRQAISRAIDRDRILARDYRNQGIISESIYFPGAMGSDPEERLPKDLDRAKDLLDELGYIDGDGDGIIEDENGKPINLVIILRTSKENGLSICQHIKEDIEPLGIGLEIVSLGDEEYLEALSSGNFDIYLESGINDGRNDLKALFAPDNYIGFYDQETIDVINQLEEALTPEEMSLAFNTARIKLSEQMPYLNLCYTYNYFWSTSTLEGASGQLGIAPYRDIVKWNWKKRVEQEGDVS